MNANIGIPLVYALLIIGLIGTISTFVLFLKFGRARRNRAARISLFLLLIFAVAFASGIELYSNPPADSCYLITAYTSNGLITEKYEGEITIKEKKPGYVSFIDENGEEHTISCKDGTLIIEEGYCFDFRAIPQNSVVSVRTSNGLIIENFSGEFIFTEKTAGYVSFDNPNKGHRTTISSSGTIIIDK